MTYMAAASTPPVLSQRRKIVVYLAVLAGMFMASLDMQIIATALPTITEALGDLELFGWVGAGYLLVTAAVTPFYGKLGDLFGRKRVFMVAIALFTLGSLACGMAWSMQSLIAARVLQGLGGGGLMTSAFAIIADLFEPRERAKYQGFSSAVFTLSGLIGPVAGGFIAQSFGWEYIFLINLPVGILVIAVLAFAMPSFSPKRSHSIDYLGGLLLAGSVTALVFWAEEALGGSYSGPLIFILPIVVIAALTAFVMVERRAAEPILPLGILKNRQIALTLVMSILMGVATLGMLNYFALAMQMITGLPPAMAGLLFLPSSVGSLLAAIVSGNITARTGRYKIFPVIGMALGVAALYAFSFINAETPYWAIGILMFCFSICMGLQMQTLMVAVQSSAPKADVGAATGALTLSRMIGASLGLAANGGLLHGALQRAQNALPADVVAQLPAPLPDLTPKAVQELPPELGARMVEAFAGAFSNVLYFGAGLFAVGFLLALLLKDVRLPVQNKKTEENGAAMPAVAE